MVKVPPRRKGGVCRVAGKANNWVRTASRRRTWALAGWLRNRRNPGRLRTIRAPRMLALDLASGRENGEGRD
jgi:hypothetical protein